MLLSNLKTSKALDNLPYSDYPYEFVSIVYRKCIRNAMVVVLPIHPILTSDLKVFNLKLYKHHFVAL